jgi:predicted 3-demethylubiquinone-9 3-methyltransferase (glyoxalase superfamily)
MGAKIVPHLWYAKEAEEAARFYASVFPDSRVVRVTPLAADTPSGPRRAAEAMLAQVKFDIAKLEAAFEGR